MPSLNSLRQTVLRSLVVGLFIVLTWGLYTALAGPGATTIPAPVAGESLRPNTPLETAVLAGGCFWGVQAVFQHVKGVTQVLSGYSGGTKETARYEPVSVGATGHAESVEVTFDPSLISYGTILQIFFSVAHNPTEFNRQGPDVGPQYRSAIFANGAAQRRIAEAYVAQLDKAGAFARRIVTQIDDLSAFYPAEDYHQDYVAKHPNSPYVAYHDLPKLDSLKRLYPALYKNPPVLVGALPKP